MTLTVTQECLVARRVMQAPGILRLARHGNRAGAGKIARGEASCGGGSEVGDGIGPYWYDSKSVRQSQSGGDWVVTWDRVAAVTLAGLTPGFLAHLSVAYRFYCRIHHAPFDANDQDVNAVHDPLAYETWWWPSYLRASRMMRQAEDAIFERAAVILEPPTVAQLSLWDAA